MSTHSLNRRSILAGIGSALTLTATTAAVVSTTVQPAAGDAIGDFLAANPDAELLALGAELDAAWERERLAFDVSNAADKASSPDADHLDDVWDKLVDQAGEIVHRIIPLQATTLAGVMVKVRAVAWCYCGKPEDIITDDEHYMSDVHLALGIARDLSLMPAVGT
ncbi:hypothetical protein [Chthonobacter albigriseus]|uniref:hypothetical protein n=1 Tax=Chthonobacter albigriseus TaxID=1683161 RepID=UPI0015EF0342|nr:hypothetical protein [Chthonobacter albigriseus]